MVKQFLLLVISWGISIAVYAQTPLPKFEAELNRFASDSNLKSATWGLCVMDIKTGKKLITRNEYASLSPASTVKVLTTFAALSILGSDYRFRTTLLYNGKVSKDSILTGNVIIKGGGDPTLGSDRIKTCLNENCLVDTLILALKKAGIKTVKGKIIADDSHFDEATTPPGWAWEDMGNYYGAGTSGLNFHENVYTLYMKAGDSINAPAHIKSIAPEAYGMDIKNRVSTAPKGSGDGTIIFGSPNSLQREIAGTVPMGDTAFKIYGSLPDGALLLAQMVALKLGSVSAAVKETCDSATLSEAREVYNIYSPKLKDIILYTNVWSINLFAETLLKETGWKKSGRGSREDGLKAVYRFWKKKGLNMQGFFMTDGSGLSRNNAISAYQFATAMQLAAKDSAFEDFLRSLPINGYVGNLLHLNNAYTKKKHVRAKTGYMNRVWSYTGYVVIADKPLLSFAFIINNYPAPFSTLRKKTDALLQALAN